MTHEPQIEYAGADCLEQLPAVLERYGARDVFLVVGTNSYNASGAEAALTPMLASHPVTTFAEFRKNTQFADVETGVERFRESGGDVVIAVGGGSVIDMAKLINGLAAQPHDKREYILGKRHLEQPIKPLIVIPTTAGSGSEATHFAVVYMDDKKYSLAHDMLLPNVVLLDSQLSMSMPLHVTASTGMDALCQAIESYWSVHACSESRAYAAEAIPLVLDHLEKAVRDPDAEARFAMARAANLAGKAINITKTTACHAMSYALTSHWNVPHGHAVALTLGEMYVYISEVNDKDVLDPRGVDHVRQTITELNALLGCPSADQARNRIDELMKAIGLETRLSELGIAAADDIDDIVESVNPERLRNNPRQLSEPSARAILERIR